MNRFVVIAGGGYLLMVAVLVAGLFLARSTATKNFATTDARQAWNDWRQDTEAQQDSDLPVERSVPRSEEPPTLVLLRDHFVVCTAAGLSLTTVLYWTVALFVRGIASGPKFQVDYRTTSGERRS